MNTCHMHRANQSVVSWPQHLTTAIRQLQTLEINAFKGSVYIYDLVEQCTLYANCAVANLLGYTADTIQNMDAITLACLIHPDDLDSVSDHYQRLVTLPFGMVVTVNYRMRRADGSWCWLHSQETPLMQTTDGFPRQIVGAVQVMAQVPVLSLEDLLRQTERVDYLN